MKRIFFVASALILLLPLGVLLYAHSQSIGYVTPTNSASSKWSLAFAGFLGHDSAAHMLASMRVFSSNDPEGRRKGFSRLEKEYKDGSAYSAGKLGWAYQRGLGADANLERAIELYEEAARRGMTYWQFLLAHAHEEGYLGFPPSEERAEYWLAMEPKIHIDKYECWVANYYRDGIFPSNEEKLAEYANICEGSLDAREET